MVFLLPGVCCDLFKQYATTLNFNPSKSNSLTAMQVALQAMVDDAIPLLEGRPPPGRWRIPFPASMC
jgi:hypothetical protein